MQSIEFRKADWPALRELTAAYLADLRHQNDGFHHNKIFENAAYRIEFDGETRGFFSLGDSWEGGKLLCAFYLVPAARHASAAIFSRVLEEMDVRAALVVSNDALFVSLAFETMRARNAAFDMQAYNFTYGKPSRPAEYGPECLERVLPGEYETMNRLTQGQWEGCFGHPDYVLFALRHAGKTLGYGALARMPHHDGYVDVGNFTLPEYRRQGVGRSIIIHLSDLALQNRLTPVAGCWYGNRESFLTLTSSGFIPENRIFFVRFDAQEPTPAQ